MSLCHRSSGQHWMECGQNRQQKYPNVLEAVPIAEVRRLASKFFDCRCQKSAGILCVFQDFLAKAGGKFAVKMRAAAIGTASKSLSPNYPHLSCLHIFRHTSPKSSERHKAFPRILVSPGKKPGCAICVRLILGWL